jgi:hypothetical protein
MSSSFASASQWLVQVHHLRFRHMVVAAGREVWINRDDAESTSITSSNRWVCWEQTRYVGKFSYVFDELWVVSGGGDCRREEEGHDYQQLGTK